MSDMRPNKAEVEFYRKVNQQLVQKDKLIRSLQKKLDDLQERVAPPSPVDPEGHEVELELQQLERQLMMLTIEEATQSPPSPPHEEPVMGAVQAAIAPAAVDEVRVDEAPFDEVAVGEVPSEEPAAEQAASDWDAFLSDAPVHEKPVAPAIGVEEPAAPIAAEPAPAPQLSLVMPRSAETPAASPGPAPEASDAEASAYAAALTQRARRKLEHLRSMAEADSDAAVLTAALRLYEWYLWRSRQGYRLQLAGEDGVRDVDLLL